MNLRAAAAVAAGVNARAVASWSVLLAVSIAISWLLQRLGVPAPWLLGALICGIIASAGGVTAVRMPRAAFAAAQAAVGTLIAQTFTPPVLVFIARSWAIMALVVATTVVSAALAGWLLARFSPIEAETAAWGSAPGGATAMTAMSADYGADQRIVAFMQYLRVTLVVVSATAVARALLPHVAHPLSPPTADPRDAGLLPLLETLGVAVVGTWIALRARVPAGPLLGPMLLGAVLHGAGVVRLAVPPLVLDAAYLAVGLSIGLLYTRETVRYVVKVLPPLLASTLVLIALCAVSGAILAAAARIDPLTAYLATTPGGLDSVTVIALGSGANTPLVLAVQTLRLFVVILSGPPIARLIARAA